MNYKFKYIFSIYTQWWKNALKKSILKILSIINYNYTSVYGASSGKIIFALITAKATLSPLSYTVSNGDLK